MSKVAWEVQRCRAVREFIEQQDDVVRNQLDKDIKKLEAYGDAASEPLVKHLDEKVWYLRSMVRGRGWYRIFYFRNGPRSFCAFFPYHKRRHRLPRNVEKQVMAMYRDIVHNGGC